MSEREKTIARKYWYRRAVEDLFRRGWNGECEDRKFENAEEVIEWLTKPPEGWCHFGTHVDIPCELEFSEVLDDDGLPMWERCKAGHEGLGQRE